MKKIPDSFIADLKSYNRLEDVMGSYTTVKRSGRDFVCCCPIHSERTPSCHIYTRDSHYHCYGCGATGDVITLVRQMEGLEYLDALRFLAKRAGLTMPELENSGNGRLQMRILSLNRTAALYYNQLLTRDRRGERGRRYLMERGLTPDTITRYGLGYAPDEWQCISDHLRSQGFTEEEMIAADLVRRGRNGKLYDFYRDRIIFPIIKPGREVIAFGARLVEGDGPKYLNSSDTPVFKKSENLFSYNFAKKSKDNRIILCEGYMDVIAMNQAGFDGAVASLGTSLTERQAKIISDSSREVIIAYDSDGAGQKATQRAIEMFDKLGVRIKVLKVTGAKDPDEFIKKFGKAAFANLLDECSGGVAFELERLENAEDMSSDLGRMNFINNAMKFLSSLSNAAEADYYAKKLADRMDMPLEGITSQIRTLRRKEDAASVRNAPPPRREEPPKPSGRLKAERNLLAYICRYPEDTAVIKAAVSAGDFSGAAERELYAALIEHFSEGGSDHSPVQEKVSPGTYGQLLNIIGECRNIDYTEQARDELIEKIKRGRKRGAADLAALAAEKKKGR